MQRVSVHMKIHMNPLQQVPVHMNASGWRKPATGRMFPPSPSSGRPRHAPETRGTQQQNAVSRDPPGAAPARRRREVQEVQERPRIQLVSAWRERRLPARAIAAPAADWELGCFPAEGRRPRDRGGAPGDAPAPLDGHQNEANSRSGCEFREVSAERATDVHGNRTIIPVPVLISIPIPF